MALLSAEPALDDARVRFLRAVLRDGLRESHEERSRQSKHGAAKPLTLLEAATVANLSRPSVHQYYDSLRKAGVVPRDRVGIDPAAAFVVGVDVRETHPVRVAICDAHGETFPSRPVWPTESELKQAGPRRVDTEKHANMHANVLLDFAAQGILNCVEELGLKPERLIGIGISLPGPVVNGLAIGPTPGPWSLIRADRRLAARLASWAPQLDPETMIVTRSDAYASALLEHFRGAPEASADHTIYVKWSVDLRAAIIVNGEPYAGHKGTAGELGHIVIDDDDAISVLANEDQAHLRDLRQPCRICGNAQCLHELASMAYLSRVARRSPEAQLLSGEAIAAYAGTDPVLMYALNTAARGIGIAVASYVATLNPQTVVLGGAIGSRIFESVMEQFTQPIGERVPPNVSDVAIVGAARTRHTATLGAAACALLECGPAYFRKLMLAVA
jgi:predicted NBD/HSP70 family sugar kinase